MTNVVVYGISKKHYKNQYVTEKSHLDGRGVRAKLSGNGASRNSMSRNAIDPVGKRPEPHLAAARSSCHDSGRSQVGQGSSRLSTNFAFERDRRLAALNQWRDLLKS